MYTLYTRNPGGVWKCWDSKIQEASIAEVERAANIQWSNMVDGTEFILAPHPGAHFNNHPVLQGWVKLPDTPPKLKVVLNAGC